MDKQANTRLKTTATNFFGAIGYLFCSIQWLWVVVLYFSLINSLILFISPNANKPAPLPPTPPTPVAVSSSPLLFIFGLAIFAAIITLTIYTLYKIPSTIAKTSKKVVREAAESATPIVLRVQHKKGTKKSHMKITSSLIVMLKITIVTVPVVLAMTSKLLDKLTINYDIAVVAGLWLAGFSVAAFSFQYLVARLLSIKTQDLW